MIDYNWTSETNTTNDDSTVHLFTLSPVAVSKKSLTSDWYDQRRSGGWMQHVLPLFADIVMVTDMNQALTEKNWNKTNDFIKAGINVNRGIYAAHPIWGDVVTDTYLEYVMCCDNSFNTVKMLIEKGAKISQETLPMIAGNANVEMFNYFLHLGCDINAIDSVGCSALNRALAFHNQSLIEHIISLGGVYRVQQCDKKEELQKLLDMGVRLDDGTVVSK